MNKKNKVDWSNIDGALPKPKRLHLEKDETDSLYHCPVQVCDHEGFQSQRGCRKHLNSKHSWFFYFDGKPELKHHNQSAQVSRTNLTVTTTNDCASTETTRIHAVKLFPSFSVCGKMGQDFANWLTGSGVGYKKDRTAKQIAKRSFKLLKFSCEDEEELTFEVIDYSLCSPNLLFKFIDFLQDECKLGHGGRLGYIDAISDLMDFRKINGASDTVLQNLSATELYLKRARKTVAKMMRLQWS